MRDCRAGSTDDTFHAVLDLINSYFPSHYVIKKIVCIVVDDASLIFDVTLAACLSSAWLNSLIGIYKLFIVWIIDLKLVIYLMESLGDVRHFVLLSQDSGKANYIYTNSLHLILILRHYDSLKLEELVFRPIFLLYWKTFWGNG